MDSGDDVDMVQDPPPPIQNEQEVQYIKTVIDLRSKEIEKRVKKKRIKNNKSNKNGKRNGRKRKRKENVKNVKNKNRKRMKKMNEKVIINIISSEEENFSDDIDMDGIDGDGIDGDGIDGDGDSDSAHSLLLPVK